MLYISDFSKSGLAVWVGTAVIIALIAIGAYFSVIESALIFINRAKGGAPDENDDEALGYLAEIPKKITATRIIITFAKVFAGFTGGVTYSPVFFALTKNYIVSVALSVAFTAFFVTVFVELSPKSVGVKYSEQAAVSSNGLTNILIKILKPLIFAHTALADLLTRLAKVSPDDVDFVMSEEEIRRIVANSGDKGEIDKDEIEMINNIFEFDNTSAGDIATHRTEIVAFRIDESIQELKEKVINEKFSRFPVYNENIDDIVGVFHIKDFTKELIYRGEDGFDLKNILKEPYFVPFSKKNDELFKQMQKNKVHMAIIIDEYGGTAGIVTMEDLIEEIVGNIFDEYDVEDEEITPLGGNAYLLKGTADIADVEETLGVELDPDNEYDTIGGFIIGCLGRIPDESEAPLETEKEGYVFKIERIEEKRIVMIRAIKQNL